MLSRADGGHTVLNRDPVNLSASVRDIVGQLSVLAEAKNQTVQVDAPDEVQLNADMGICRHVVVNLLDNAIKYGPPGSVIQVTVRRQGGEAVVEVSDEGPGVDAEHRERIFERFYRIDKVRSREVGGSGLGLSIARGFCLLFSLNSIDFWRLVHLS